MANVRRNGAQKDALQAIDKKLFFVGGEIKMKSKIFGVGKSNEIIFIILGFSFLFYLCSRNGEETAQESSSESPPSSADSYLYAGEAKYIPMARTKEALDKYVKFSIARDNFGMNFLISSGAVLNVPSKTKVLILDRGFVQTEVRILEGEYTGHSGWLPAEWVK